MARVRDRWRVSASTHFTWESLCAIRYLAPFLSAFQLQRVERPGPDLLELDCDLVKRCWFAIEGTQHV